MKNRILKSLRKKTYFNSSISYYAAFMKKKYLHRIKPLTVFERYHRLQIRLFKEEIRLCLMQNLEQSFTENNIDPKEVYLELDLDKIIEATGISKRILLGEEYGKQN